MLTVLQRHVERADPLHAAHQLEVAGQIEARIVHGELTRHFHVAFTGSDQQWRHSQVLCGAVSLFINLTS